MPAGISRLLFSPKRDMALALAVALLPRGALAAAFLAGQVYLVARVVQQLALYGAQTSLYRAER